MQDLTTDFMKKVTIYTDGGCSGNPGPGGYGAVLLYGTNRKEISEGYKLTTNNRMEMLACIKALEILKYPCEVSLFSDSKYVINGIEKGWAKKWEANNWKRNKDEMAKNPDLWSKLLRLCESHNVTFTWVKGHAGNNENERCDELTNIVRTSENLQIDEGYNKQINPALSPLF